MLLALTIACRPAGEPIEVERPADTGVAPVATDDVGPDEPPAGEDTGEPVGPGEDEPEDPVGASNELGVWLWYIEGTGYSHAELASKLAAMGVKRVYVKVADGAASCSSWPELCDTSVPATYQAAGLEAWAWSYNYPGGVQAQADALTQAVATGYEGYVLDIETEFDGATTTLEALLEAFWQARNEAAPEGWELRATTWGNPTDHGMRVDIIDAYVDAHMPQTYLEVWGATYMQDAKYWVDYGTCEYRGLGAVKPVHHIISTEYDDITPSELHEAIGASGAGTSLWRIPGEGTLLSIWTDWEALDWDRVSFDTPPC